jgi:hypothetical protein
VSGKILVMVFLAVDVCGCSQTGFLGRVYEAVRKYKDAVDYREYSAGSEVAKRYGVGYRGVVVGDKSLGSNPTSTRIEEAILREIEKEGIEEL